MIKTRRLNERGLATFSNWLEAPNGGTPPDDLIVSDDYSELYGEYEVDPEHAFNSRQEFGAYLNEAFKGGDIEELLSPACDGLWAWLAVVYFRQLAPAKIRRAEHYIVIRKGPVGTLAYRHAVRTSFELVHVHGQNSWICLRGQMHTFGELAEQLASRRTVAYNRGFFQTAHRLYVDNGYLRRGASSKPKRLRDRKAGDKTGFGSIRRLAIALQRLDLTYDTEAMVTDLMLSVLPKEFSKWKAIG